MEEILRKAFEYGMEYIAVPVAGIPFDIWYTQHKDKIDLAIEEYLHSQAKEIILTKELSKIKYQNQCIDSAIEKYLKEQNKKIVDNTPIYNITWK